MSSKTGQNAASRQAVSTRLRSFLARLFHSSTVAESLGFYLPTAVIYRALGLVRGVLLAWLISKQEFGTFQIVLLAVNILVPLCAVGLSEALTRYVPQYEARHRLRAFLRRVVPFALLLATALCAAVFLAAQPISRLLFTMFGHGESASAPTGSRVPLLHLTAVTTLILIAYVLVLAIVRGLRMFLAVSMMELISNVLFTLLAVLAAVVGYQSAEAVMICYALGYLATLAGFGLPLWMLLVRSPGQTLPLEESEARLGAAPLLARILSYSLWSAMAAVSWQLVQYYPMWFLQKVHGPEVVAVCGGIHLVTQAVLIAATSVVMVIQPTVTRTWETLGQDAARHQLSLAHKITSLVTLSICAILDLGAPWLIRLFPAGYAAGQAIIPLSLTFFMVAGQVVFLAVHFTLVEKTRYQFVAWIIAVACNAFFAARCIRPELPPDLSLVATVWAELLGITGALLITLFILRLEQLALDRGSMLLIVAGYLLILPPSAMITVVTGLVVLASATNLVFDRNEKQEGRAYLASVRAGILSRVGGRITGSTREE